MDEKKIEWCISNSLVEYPQAMKIMADKVDKIIAGEHSDYIWLLEHPSLYTAGSSADPQDMRSYSTIPVYYPGRGGKFTYHGPGQRIIYAMINLEKRGKDLRLYLRRLEQWLINTLAYLRIEAFTVPDKTGVWVTNPRGAKAKIAAIGVKCRKWVTYHGAAINISTDLSYYQNIIPCGDVEGSVTSLADMGYDFTMEQVDKALRLHAHDL